MSIDFPYPFKGATSSVDGQIGFVPHPAAGQQGYFLRGDGLWAPALVSVPVYRGASSGAAGVTGTVPAAAAGQQNLFLRGDGTWDAAGSPGVFTATVDGLVPHPGTSDNTSGFYLGGDAAWHAVPPTVPIYAGASSGSGGVTGTVPPATAGQQNYVLQGDGTWITANLLPFTGAGSGSAGTGGTVPAPGAGETGQFLIGSAAWTPFASIGVNTTNNFVAIGGNPSNAVAAFGTTILGISTALIEGGNAHSVDATTGMNWIGSAGTAFAAGIYNNSAGDGLAVKIVGANATDTVLDLSYGATPSGAGTNIGRFTKNGAVFGTATGGAQGAGTLNATNLYVNGVAVGLPAVFTGATGSANGTTGLVPQPLATQQAYLLVADGAWHSPASLVAAPTTNGANGGTGFITSAVAGQQLSVMNAAGNWSTFFALDNANSRVLFGGFGPLRSSALLSNDQGTNSPSLITDPTGLAVNPLNGVNWYGPTSIQGGHGYTAGFFSSDNSATSNIGVMVLKAHDSANGDILNCCYGTSAAGAATAVFRVTAGLGVIVAAASGGGQGPGTVNATGYFINGVALTAPTNFTGATSGANGAAGQVPQPTSGQQGALLLGGGAWSTTLNVNTAGSNRVGIGVTAPASQLANTTTGVFATSGNTSGSNAISWVGTGSAGDYTAGLQMGSPGTGVLTLQGSASGVILLDGNVGAPGTSGTQAFQLSGGGAVFGVPTGGVQGAGTINVSAGYYINGSLVPTTAFGAATSGAAGTLGMVPAPAAGQQTFFLRGDSTWAASAGASTSVANTWTATQTFAAIATTSLNLIATGVRPANGLYLSSSNVVVSVGSTDEVTFTGNRIGINGQASPVTTISNTATNIVNSASIGVYGGGTSGAGLALMVSGAGNVAAGIYASGVAGGAGCLTLQGAGASTLLLECSVAATQGTAGTQVFQVTGNGLTITGTGLLVGGATGSNKGTGTINVSAGYYVNNVLLPSAALGGATSGANGTAGWAPQPTSGQQGALLLGGGAWSTTLNVNTAGSNRIGVSTTAPVSQLANTATAVFSGSIATGNTSGSNALSWVGTGSSGDFAAGIHMDSPGTGVLILQGSASGTVLLDCNVGALGSAGTSALTVTGGGTQVGSPTGGYEGAGTLNATNLYVNGTAVSTISDRKLKTEIEPTRRSGLEAVNALRVVDYRWKKGTASYREFGAGTQTGFIAQDVDPILPEAVHVGDRSKADDPWALNYGRLMPLAVKAIQELHALVADLRAELTEIKRGLL